MIIIYLIVVLLGLIFPNDTSAAKIDGYDIMIIAGQSNNLAGKGKDPNVDVGAPNIYQLGRNGNNDKKIIPATEPLEFKDNQDSPDIGYALTLARHLKTFGFATPTRPLLILPVGKGGTGFSKPWWNPGDVYELEFIDRTNFLMNDSNFNNRIIGLFWQQGEKDANGFMTQEAYETAWLNMIKDYKKKIKGFDSNIPIFIGQMVPSWIKANSPRAQRINLAHQNLPKLRPNTYFVSAELPFEIGYLDEAYLGIEDNPIHYSAASQRILASRYFDSYKKNSKIKPIIPTFDPSDFNHDGQVDIFDYNLLVTNWGNPYTNSNFIRLKKNFGN